MIIPLIILILINLISITFNVLYYLKKRKKETYAVILNSNEELKHIKKINTSEKKFMIDEDTYIISKKPLFKYENKGFILYEHKNPEPISFNEVTQLRDLRISTDVFNEILKMEHIKAINKFKEGIFSNIKPQYLLIGAIMIIAVVVYFTGGF